jgi:tripartite-type tricarboxylate transporter receptor subunit TctC
MTHCNTDRREFLQASTALASTLAFGIASKAHAQSAVEQLKILCPTPAGGIPDTVARKVAEQLGTSYPKGAIVDNRPGAIGLVAFNALKSGPVDGSVVLLAPGTFATVNPYLYAKQPYDPAIDVQPVTVAAEATLGLAVGPTVPESVANVRDLLNWMRTNPRLANVGSPGAGTLLHLLEVMLFKDAGVQWQHVAYPGGPQALVDLLGGQIAALVLPEGILRQHKATGKLRVLATSSAQRSAYLPDVPTFVEQGHRNLVVREWYAFFLPGKSSPAVADATSQALRQGIARPELATALAVAGMTPAPSTPAAMAERITQEQRYWAPVIQSAGVRFEA